MAANTAPIFTLVPNVGIARLAAANAARDGSGTIVTAFTAGTNGSRVDRITFTSAQATAALNSAMIGRVYVTGAAQANPRLRAEVVIPAATASTTAVGATAQIAFPNGLVIPSGDLICVTISVYAGVADQMDVLVEGGDY